MLKKKNVLKTMIFVTLTLTIFLTSSKVHALTTLSTIYYNDYNINSNAKFASIDNHDIYIIKGNNSRQYRNNDIVIIDLRDETEDIKILSSYRIKNKYLRNAIINIILKYNKAYPSEKPWIRSQKSLNNEWIIHNILYYFYLYRNHTRDVDFVQSEEKLYSLSLLD